METSLYSLSSDKLSIALYLFYLDLCKKKNYKKNK